MITHPVKFGVWVSLTLAGLAHAHIAAWVPGMYCINGTDPTANPNNNNAPVQPLYDLPYNEFWMHHSNGCDQFPPDEGVFLELPAGGNVTVELAGNRADTTLNTDPNAVLTEWGDGLNHADYDKGGTTCITSPNLHTQNQTMAAGTAFAIAYESDITKVTLKNLIVFTVRYHTPWKRIASYDIPSGMPPCPDGGCICTWLWIPDGCGQPNMYMFPYRCKVIPDSTTPKTIGVPQPAVWCEDDPSKCVQGPKQMLIWNQADSNNIVVDGYDLSGDHKSPAYNAKCGFSDGAQMDIFVESGAMTTSTAVSGATVGPSSTATSTSPTGSGAPGFLASAPASSGNSTLPPSDPASTPPAGSGASSLPSSDPTSSPSAGSGASSLPIPNPASTFPGGSGTSSLPTSDPGFTPTAAPSTATDPSTTCRWSDQETSTADPAARSKRMMHRREKRNVF